MQIIIARNTSQTWRARYKYAFLTVLYFGETDPSSEEWKKEKNQDQEPVNYEI